MKLAVAGKGGSGKTSIAGTMARVMARNGQRVLAIDGDSNPNLALTLGVPAEEMDGLDTLPRGAVERRDGAAVLSTPVAELCHHHATTTPDGVRLLVMANPKEAGTGCLCGMHATVRATLEAAGIDDADVCIVDTEASPEHLSRGTTRHADTMLVVVEPYFKSLESGRRMAALARDLGIERIALVANKVRDESELAAVRQLADRCGVEVAASIPWDAAMGEAERARTAPLDYSPEGPATEAIRQLAVSLLDERG